MAGPRAGRPSPPLPLPLPPPLPLPLPPPRPCPCPCRAPPLVPLRCIRSTVHGILLEFRGPRSSAERPTLAGTEDPAGDPPRPNRPRRLTFHGIDVGIFVRARHMPAERAPAASRRTTPRGPDTSLQRHGRLSSWPDAPAGAHPFAPAWPADPSAPRSMASCRRPRPPRPGRVSRPGGNRVRTLSRRTVSRFMALVSDFRSAFHRVVTDRCRAGRTSPTCAAPSPPPPLPPNA